MTNTVYNNSSLSFSFWTRRYDITGQKLEVIREVINLLFVSPGLYLNIYLKRKILQFWDENVGTGVKVTRRESVDFCTIFPDYLETWLQSSNARVLFKRRNGNVYNSICTNSISLLINFCWLNSFVWTWTLIARVKNR